MAHHREFYSRFLLFDDVSEAPRLSPKTGQQVSYVRLNLETMKERYEQRYARATGRRNLYRWFFQNEDEPAIVDWMRCSQSTDDDGGSVLFRREEDEHPRQRRS